MIDLTIINTMFNINLPHQRVKKMVKMEGRKWGYDVMLISLI